MNSNSLQNEWASSKASISIAEIEGVARRLEYTFPEAFLNLASKFNGGYPSKTNFDAGDRKGCVFDYLLHCPDEFFAMYTALKDRLPRDLVPFASDAFGNAICFDYRESGPNGEPAIAFWDHESQGSGSICVLADSFEDFANNKLYTKKRLYET